MNNTELQVITTNIKGQLKSKLIAPLIISGSPGIGKSSSIRAIASELDMNIVEFSCPVLTIEFLSGLPNETTLAGYIKSLIIRTTDKVIGTTWSMPEMLTSVWTAAETKPTILLLDDFHGTSPHLLSYFYQLLLDRKLGNYRLPDNVVILGTMNDSDLAGFNGISSAIRNRLGILAMKFNFDHWFTQNGGNQLHYLVASFLKAKPHYCQEDESTSIQGYATPRAWTAIAAELAHHTSQFVHANAGLLAGTQVSADAAKAFHSHVLYVEAVNFTKLVANRTIVDLSTKDPLDSIIYSYITNFITTVDDGLYLFDLINANMNNSASSFIGFTMGELYIKFQHDKDMSDGIRFVIDRVIGLPMDPKKYSSTSKQKLEKAFATPVERREEIMGLAGNFIM